VQYIKQKQYKPTAVIMLTDGYLDGSPAVFDVPTLWGVVDNEAFKAPCGQVLHIQP
jgi:hypothetical protein